MYGVLRALRTFARDDEGATAVEYGLLVALIAAVIIGAVRALGISVGDAFTDFNTKAAAAGM